MNFLDIAGYSSITEIQNECKGSCSCFILSLQSLESDADSFSSHNEIRRIGQVYKGLRIQSNPCTLIDEK